MSQDEATKLLRKMSHARREVIKAGQRIIDFQHSGGEFREGHIKEMVRRLTDIQQAAEKGMEVFDMGDKIQVTIPGAVWYDALDPQATGMQAELGLGEPEVRKRGRGYQMVYFASPEVAKELADYLFDRATTLLGNTEPEERGVLWRTIKVAEKIRDDLR